jgi:hypothetical protein
MLDHDRDSYEIVGSPLLGKQLDFLRHQGVTIPVGVSAFQYELHQALRSWSEKAYPKLVY